MPSTDAQIDALTAALLKPLREVGEMLARSVDALAVRVEALENETERLRDRIEALTP